MTLLWKSIKSAPHEVPIMTDAGLAIYVEGGGWYICDAKGSVAMCADAGANDNAIEPSAWHPFTPIDKDTLLSIKLGDAIDVTTIRRESVLSMPGIRVDMKVCEDCISTIEQAPCLKLQMNEELRFILSVFAGQLMPVFVIANNNIKGIVTRDDLHRAAAAYCSNQSKTFKQTDEGKKFDGSLEAALIYCGGKGRLFDCDLFVEISKPVVQKLIDEADGLIDSHLAMA